MATLIESQRNLLGIIASVESGVTTPEEAVEEFRKLKEDAPDTFKANYTLEDFQRIRTNYASQYDSSSPEIYDYSTSY